MSFKKRFSENVLSLLIRGFHMITKHMQNRKSFRNFYWFHFVKCPFLIFISCDSSLLWLLKTRTCNIKKTVVVLSSYNKDSETNEKLSYIIFFEQNYQVQVVHVLKSVSWSQMFTVLSLKRNLDAHKSTVMIVS